MGKLKLSDILKPGCKLTVRKLTKKDLALVEETVKKQAEIRALNDRPFVNDVITI